MEYLTRAEGVWVLPALPGWAGMSGKAGKGGRKPWSLYVSICVRSPWEGKPGLLKFCLLQPEPNSLRTYWAWRAVCVCAQCFKHGCFCFVDVLGAGAGVGVGGTKADKPSAHLSLSGIRSGLCWSPAHCSWKEPGRAEHLQG